MAQPLGPVGSTPSFPTERNLEGGGKFYNKTGYVANVILSGCHKEGIGSYYIEVEGGKICRPEPYSSNIFEFKGNNIVNITEDGPFIRVHVNTYLTPTTFYVEKKEQTLNSYGYLPKELTQKGAIEKIPADLDYKYIAYNRHGVVSFSGVSDYHFAYPDEEKASPVPKIYVQDYHRVTSEVGGWDFAVRNNDYFLNGEPATVILRDGK